MFSLPSRLVVLNWKKYPRNGEAPKKERKSIDFVGKNSISKRKMIWKIWSCFVAESTAHI